MIKLSLLMILGNFKRTSRPERRVYYSKKGFDSIREKLDDTQR